MDDSNSLHSLPEPAGLRRLRIMVMILTGTLTLGVIIIVGLMLATFGRGPQPLPLPEQVILPEGEAARAFTQGTGWVAVVTSDADGVERIRVFGPDGRALQVVDIAR